MEIKRYNKNLFKTFNAHVEIYIHNYKTKELLGTIKIDLDDFEKVTKYKWCLNSHGYARCKDIELMHRWLINAKKDEIVDHINENKLDNRKSNLRLVNKSLNGYNKSKPRKDNKSGKRGVTKHRGKYRATIRINGKQTHLGLFDTIENAHQAYENKRKEVMCNE